MPTSCRSAPNHHFRLNNLVAVFSRKLKSFLSRCEQPEQTQQSNTPIGLSATNSNFEELLAHRPTLESFINAQKQTLQKAKEAEEPPNSQLRSRQRRAGKKRIKSAKQLPPPHTRVWRARSCGGAKRHTINNKNKKRSK